MLYKTLTMPHQDIVMTSALLEELSCEIIIAGAGGSL